MILTRSANLPTTQSFFLFGARGTGKTTLIKERFLDEQTLYIDLLKYQEFQQLAVDPGSLEKRINALPSCHRIVIDEVQRIPAVLNEVHRLIEESPGRQFILTGSSARKLKRGGANLLAGRAFVYNLFPVLHSEARERFDLDWALQWGTLPRMFDITEEWARKEYLLAYSDTYLREEILQEQLIRNLDPFQRFLPIAAQSSGSILNYRTIARDVGAAPQTIQSYFQILDETLIGFFLPAYHPSIRKQERVSPKFYLFDQGVLRSLSRQLDSQLVPGTYAFGRAFEHFIIQQIRAAISYSRKQHELYYYQTQGGLEVDLVIDRPGSPVVLLEIKSSPVVRADHCKHLQAAAEAFKNCEAYCFSLDPIRKKFGDVLCLPWQEGLAELGY